MRLVRPLALAAIAMFSTAGIAVPAAAQSLLYRSPNLGGTWVPAGGVLQFNFLHRFTVSDATTNNVVTNYPTFTFALGLGRRIGLGSRFATRSLVGTGGGSNEFELLARAAFGKEEGENGFAIAFTPAYNTAAESFDGEISLDLTRGPLTLSVANRAMTQALGGDPAVGFAGGASLRLNDYIALDGDVGTLIDAGRDAAWSAGISFVIPGSPHTFSLHAGNAASATIQGASFGIGVVTYGFEFTIPIHFSRFAPWFAKKDRAVEENVPFMNAAAARVEMREYRFGADSVTITAGQSVGWINHDQVAHTVTFETSGPQSSGDLAAGGTHVVTFARPGVYRYHCAPHPMMKGVVVVK